MICKLSLDDMRLFFESGETKKLSYRKAALLKLRDAIYRYKTEIVRAVYNDLQKSEGDIILTEIGPVLQELNYMLKNLHNLAKPKKLPTPIYLFGAKSYIYKEPFGLILIIAPWNYPFQLLFMPLIGAIAAGNCVVLKPSEHAKSTAKIISEILTEIYDPDHIKVEEGDAESSKQLLRLKFDLIFFTGSTSVGRYVMQEAAKTLTPVIMELGGKSPVIVAEDADVKLAARRIVWGKFLNSGQTCVAPDYLVVHRSIHQRLVSEMKKALSHIYGRKYNHGKIINQAHFNRLRELLSDREYESDPAQLKIAPVITDNVNWDDRLMREEIFGPVLPVLEYIDLDKLIKKIQSFPKPLALYLFTNNLTLQDKVLNSLSFGGGCINDTVLHLASNLPFGGVGLSGFGMYKGEYSFNTFSNHKGILKQTNLWDWPFRYFPEKFRNIINFFLLRK